MEFLPAELENYIAKHTDPEPGVLKKLNRETQAKVLLPRMLAGHLQGRVLSMLSHMIKPKNVLEIGTYTGYSAICWTEGLQKDGRVITIDNNEELEEMARGYFEAAGVSDKIDFRIGNAMDVIPEIDEMFDLVYIDADKQNYSNYFDLVFDKVTKDGYIIADNVLWSGKVLNDAEKMDVDTRSIVEFNQKVQEDQRVQNVLFPVRDGLMVCRKRKS